MLCCNFCLGQSEVCENWFLRNFAKIDASDCELSCNALSTNLATSGCRISCQKLCDLSGKTSIAGKVIYYPGLNPTEKRLVERNPWDAIEVFIQKIRAEQLTHEKFPDGSFNDESDAFRHFIWSGLMTFQLGADKAKAFSDAHEQDPRQPLLEKSVDLANNRAGILSAQQFLRLKIPSIENLKDDALRSLRSGELIVIKKGLPIPEKAIARRVFNLAEFLSPEEGLKKWGRKKFDPESFRKTPLDQRAPLIMDFILNQYFIGKKIETVRLQLGPPDGYLFSESLIAYSIGADPEWQVAFIRNEQFQSVKEVKIHRKCCYLPPEWLK